MKIVIHIGMHKTGSSSIQQTFAPLKHPDLEYIDWDFSGNHSTLFVLLFQDADKLAEYHEFKARGPEFIRGLPALREDWRKRVSAQLAGAADKTVIFSGEDISNPSLENALPRLRDFFGEWSNDISVIGYARPPAGFMVSAFQQYLRGGTIANLSKGGASPQYRARFERIDQTFGRDIVRLREFSPDRMLNGDVVQDFAHEIGLGPLKEDQIIRANESRSLEAAALLYVQRKLGQGFVQGFDGAQVVNNTFIARLATIGTRKFAFSPQMLAPILEKERDDIAWMEDRLGHGFSGGSAAHKDAISSLDDLVDIALEQYDAVQELLGEKAAIEGPATPESLVRALERLREKCYAQVVDARSAKRSLQQKGTSSMPTKTDRPQPTEEELQLRRLLANILWIGDHKDDMPSDPAERKAAFALVRQDYLKKAIDLTRRLENHKLMIVEAKPQG